MRLILKDYIETFKEEQEMENLLGNMRGYWFCHGNGAELR